LKKAHWDRWGKTVRCRAPRFQLDRGRIFCRGRGPAGRPPGWGESAGRVVRAAGTFLRLSMSRFGPGVSPVLDAHPSPTVFSRTISRDADDGGPQKRAARRKGPGATRELTWVPRRRATRGQFLRHVARSPGAFSSRCWMGAAGGFGPILLPRITPQARAADFAAAETRGRRFHPRSGVEGTSVFVKRERGEKIPGPDGRGTWEIFPRQRGLPRRLQGRKSGPNPVFFGGLHQPRRGPMRAGYGLGPRPELGVPGSPLTDLDRTFWIGEGGDG